MTLAALAQLGATPRAAADTLFRVWAPRADGVLVRTPAGDFALDAGRARGARGQRAGGRGDRLLLCGR